MHALIYIIPTVALSEVPIQNGRMSIPVPHS